MPYVKYRQESYVIVRLKKYWEFAAAGIGWRYEWYVKPKNCYGADWELSDYCNVHNCVLVCVTRGWFGWYGTLKEVK